MCSHCHGGGPRLQDVPHDVILDADRMTTLLEKYHGPKEFNRVMDSLGWTFQPKVWWQRIVLLCHGMETQRSG